MARQAYNETVSFIEEDSEGKKVLRPADGVQVSVYAAGTKTKVPIYEDRSGGVELANPILTDETGLVSFWAETGDYDIFYHDTHAPARISDYTFGWQAAPPSEEIGFELGDIKFSSQEEDHGRWIRMDGRSMTQGEIEAALTLQPGEGAAIMGLLGTGAASKYGSTAAGQIKLPDTRRRVIMGVGASGDGSGTLSTRKFGEEGGAETVKLETGHLPSHKHGVGSIATNAGGSHNHGGVTGSTSPSVTVNASPTGISIAAGGNHIHGFWGSYVTTGGPPAGSGLNIKADGSSYYASNYITESGNHGHGVNDPWHAHTGSVASHSHSISTAGEHTHSMTGESAAVGGGEAHSNMPPFVALGHCFIRV